MAVHSRLRYEQLFISKRYNGKWLSDYVQTIDFDESKWMLIGSGPVCSAVCIFFPETRPDTKGGKVDAAFSAGHTNMGNSHLSDALGRRFVCFWVSERNMWP
jgi:hypothetical protein